MKIDRAYAEPAYMLQMIDCRTIEHSILIHCRTIDHRWLIVEHSFIDCRPFWLIVEQSNNRFCFWLIVGQSIIRKIDHRRSENRSSAGRKHSSLFTHMNNNINNSSHQPAPTTPPTGTNRHQQLHQQPATVPDLPAITGNNMQKQPVKKIS